MASEAGGRCDPLTGSRRCPSIGAQRSTDRRASETRGAVGRASRPARRPLHYGRRPHHHERPRKRRRDAMDGTHPRRSSSSSSSGGGGGGWRGRPVQAARHRRRCTKRRPAPERPGPAAGAAHRGAGGPHWQHPADRAANPVQGHRLPDFGTVFGPHATFSGAAAAHAPRPHGLRRRRWHG